MASSMLAVPVLLAVTAGAIPDGAEVDPLSTPTFPASWGEPPRSTEYEVATGQRCVEKTYTHIGDDCNGWSRLTEAQCWDKCLSSDRAPHCPTESCVAAAFYSANGWCHLYSSCSATSVVSHEPVSTLTNADDSVPLAGGYGYGSSGLSLWILDNIKKDREVQFPPDFGEPPSEITDDWVPLPFGYGQGSSTIAMWLAETSRRVYGEEAIDYEALFGEEATSIASPRFQASSSTASSVSSSSAMSVASSSAHAFSWPTFARWMRHCWNRIAGAREQETLVSSRVGFLHGQVIV